jgi:hypothetical protein
VQFWVGQGVVYLIFSTMDVYGRQGRKHGEHHVIARGTRSTKKIRITSTFLVQIDGRNEIYVQFWVPKGIGAPFFMLTNTRGAPPQFVSGSMQFRGFATALTVLWPKKKDLKKDLSSGLRSAFSRLLRARPTTPAHQQRPRGTNSMSEPSY